jgi:hypothetical protein
MNIVKVAEFRDDTDYLFRIANVDYHACCGISEVNNWKQIAERAISSIETTECKRANAYDKEQRENSLRAIKRRLIDADNKIALLSIQNQNKTCH